MPTPKLSSGIVAQMSPVIPWEQYSNQREHKVHVTTFVSMGIRVESN